MISALCLLLGSVCVADDPPVVGKELPLTTRPLALIGGVRQENLVSVSEYTSKSTSLVTRVFRYVFRGDYVYTVAKLEKSLTQSKGWRHATVSKTETDFWHNMPHKSLAQQGLIIQATKLVKDKKSPSGWSPLSPTAGKGWLWVSYNEQFQPLGN